MRIGIIGAMEPEIALLLEQMTHQEEYKHGSFAYYSGTLSGADIVLVRSGVGKVAAAVATTTLINHFSPDFVVNTGSAGGFDSELNIGDIVIAENVIHHDVDVTHFGFAPGQVFDMPETYQCELKLIEAAEQAANALEQIKTKRGQVGTGDSFIGCDDAVASIRSLFPSMSAVEMEGAAIGQTCYTLNTPFVVIRSLSDIAGKTSQMSFQTYLEKAGRNSAQLVMGMIDNLKH